MPGLWSRFRESVKVNVQSHDKDFDVPVEMAKVAHTQYEKEGHKQAFHEIIRRGGFGSQEMIYYLYSRIMELTGDNMTKEGEIKELKKKIEVLSG